MADICPARRRAIHRSRTRARLERVRRSVTGRVPYRCASCNWRGWREDIRPGPRGLREIHRDLTDAEIERLEPDNAKGERP